MHVGVYLVNVPAGMNLFHQTARAPPASPLPEERYSLSGKFKSSWFVAYLLCTDLFDAKGNSASNGLFVDCLPPDIRDNQLHAVFSHTPGFKVNS